MSTCPALVTFCVPAETAVPFLKICGMRMPAVLIRARCPSRVKAYGAMKSWN